MYNVSFFLNLVLLTKRIAMSNPTDLLEIEKIRNGVYDTYLRFCQRYYLTPSILVINAISNSTTKKELSNVILKLKDLIINYDEQTGLESPWININTSNTYNFMESISKLMEPLTGTDNKYSNLYVFIISIIMIVLLTFICINLSIINS